MSSASTPSPTAGALWVHRYLLPTIDANHLRRQNKLRLLQLAPPNDEEIEELNHLGHECEGFVPTTDRPLHATQLLSSQYDLIFCGSLTEHIRSSDRMRTVFQECARILDVSGAMLALFPNPRCPINLGSSRPGFHNPVSISTPAWSDLQRNLTATNGFSELRTLSLENQFGWARTGQAVKPLVYLLESWWRHGAHPRRPLLYRSIFNPLFMIWAQK